MPTSQAPSVRRRRLGVALRRMREDSGLSTETVGRRLRWSASKVSRIETARIGVRESDIKRMLRLYQAEDHALTELLALAREAARPGWWTHYPGLPTDQAAYCALEDEADLALAYEAQVVPGLLQTEDYARCLIVGWAEIVPAPPTVIERDLQVRLKRQEILLEPRSLRLTVILGEAVLLHRVGDRKVMHRQLEQLVDLAGLCNIELRILPLDADHSAALHAFTLLEFAPSFEVTFPAVVHSESHPLSLVQDETVTHEHRRVFEWLMQRSLTSADSVHLIERTAARAWRA
ncbi:XRE family transcriptional regulator [Actinomadura sp. 7K507]|nr:helix-turn-helix transcriptional regulator [Actinomadura sp. 7K507]TDC77493.1 XRE family transcriptional regulator [Actinomadura sp. 7K507]